MRKLLVIFALIAVTLPILAQTRASRASRSISAQRNAGPPRGPVPQVA